MRSRSLASFHVNFWRSFHASQRLVSHVFSHSPARAYKRNTSSDPRHHRVELTKTGGLVESRETPFTSSDIAVIVPVIRFATYSTSKFLRNRERENMDGQWGTEDRRCENVFNWSCDKIRTLLSEFRPLAFTKRSMTTDTKLPYFTSRSCRICAHRVIDVGPDRFFVVLLRLSKTKQIRQKARQGGIRTGVLRLM
jgi:hypothetical protein